MGTREIFEVFGSLTCKQREALDLASTHLTSKQIAKKMGVAPVTIDKRIEGVRAKLGYMPRTEVLHHYRAWRTAYDRAIDDPIILPEIPASQPVDGLQPAEPSLRFEDSLAFDARAPWDRLGGRIVPRIKPSDLGPGGKLLFMLCGSVALIAAAVLSVAFANALSSMI